MRTSVDPVSSVFCSDPWKTDQFNISQNMLQSYNEQTPQCSVIYIGERNDFTTRVELLQLL